MSVGLKDEDWCAKMRLYVEQFAPVSQLEEETLAIELADSLKDNSHLDRGTC